MANQVGSFGVVASFDGGLSFYVVGTATALGAKANSASLQRTATRIDTLGDTGSLENVFFCNFGKTVSIRCYPKASTLALAAAENVKDIKQGTIIRLWSLSSATQEDTILAANSTNGSADGTLYFVTDFSKAHESGNKVVWDMTLECPDDMTVAAIT